MLEDFSQYLLDIVENSMKAGASRVEVKIEEDLQGKTIAMEVSDDGKGMNEEEVLGVCNPFFTTRTERKVGLGIPFLKQAAEACGGRLEICSGKGEGTTIRASFKSDCIDCPPLGDIPGSVVAMVVGWPEKNLYLRYAVDGKHFELEMEEIAEILEDRKLLAEPETALWLGRFVKENIETLRSGRE